MAFVVMGHRATATRHQRQAWLRPIQCLNLALLVDREHQRVLRRIQVQADYIFQLLHELRIPAQLERAIQVRLQTVTPPDTPNCSRTEPHYLGQAAGAPVSSGRRGLLSGLAHDLFDDLLRNRTPPPGTRGILQDAGDPLLSKATTPDPNGSACHLAQLSDLLILLAFRGQQDDSCLSATRTETFRPRASLSSSSLSSAERTTGTATLIFPPGGIPYQKRVTDVPEYRTHYTSGLSS